MSGAMHLQWDDSLVHCIFSALYLLYDASLVSCIIGVMHPCSNASLDGFSVLFILPQLLAFLHPIWKIEVVQESLGKTFLGRRCNFSGRCKCRCQNHTGEWQETAGGGIVLFRNKSCDNQRDAVCQHWQYIRWLIGGSEMRSVFRHSLQSKCEMPLYGVLW